MLAPIQRVGDEHSETKGASAKIKKILASFQKPQSPVIYVVECTCQQKLDTKLKKLGIKIEYLYKIQ